MTTDSDQLEAARSAFFRREWATARALLRPLRSAGLLDPDDLAVLAECSWWLGEVEEHLEVGTEVVDLRLGSGDVTGAAATALEPAVVESVRGHGAAGAGWIARARRILTDVPDAVEHGYLLILDAYGALESDDAATADALAARVLTLGDRHAEPTLQAHGLFARGRAALRAGQVELASAFLDEAMVPVVGGLTAPQWAGDLYCRMMQLCYELGDLPRAQHWTDVTEDWCRDVAPAVLFTGICRVHRVQLMQVHGEWRRALVEAGRAAADLAGLDAAVTAEAHYRLGEVHRLRGELDEARQAYEDAREAGRDPLPGQALLLLEEGRAGVAARVLDTALAATTAPLPRAPLLAARIEVALAHDVDGGAERLVDELDDIAARHDSPAWRAEACRWRGTLQAARGHDAPALRDLREALERWQQIDAPRDVARIRVELAEVLEAMGDRASARAERDLAAAAFSRLGATRELHRLTRHRHRTPEDLTPREVEVLATVAAGITNREAARRLGISERTVARHLENVYLKVGAPSRTAAVTWARDRALI